MKYITSLELDNFQCHARTRLAFSPGLNVIVGPSDQGKTAIIRALRWVLYNEPRGSDFVRVGADTCRVAVSFDDGTRIVREKGPRTNRYVLYRDGEEQVFEAVGWGVPPQVLAAHGMAALQLDADTGIFLNMGGQLEGPFLLEASGTLRAKAISQVIGAHIIDAAIRDVLNDEGRAARDEAQLSRDIAEWEEKLAEFADLPAQEEALQRAEQVLAQAHEVRQRVQRLLELKQKWVRAREEAARLGRVVARLEGLPRAERALGDAGVLMERYARLHQLAARWREITSRRAEWERVAARLADTPRAEKLLERAADLAARWQKLRDMQLRLARARERIGQAARERDQAGRQEQDLRARYGQLLVRLGKCPTCGAPITPAQVPTILADMFEEGRR